MREGCCVGIPDRESQSGPTAASDRAFQSGPTAAAGRRLLLDVDEIISNLSSSSQLDATTTTAPFGLEIFGSGQPTGIIADSGSTEVCPACILSLLVVIVPPVTVSMQARTHMLKEKAQRKETSKRRGGKGSRRKVRASSQHLA